jgi:serine protease inhibitor
MKTKYLMLLLPLVMISCVRKKTIHFNNKKLHLITLTTNQKAMVQTNNQFAFTLFNKAARKDPKRIC